MRTNVENRIKGEDIEFPSCEYRVITRSGQIMWIMETAVSVKVNDTLIMLCYAHNITPGKMMLETIKVSEAKFRKLVENAPIGISFTTLDGQILSVNEAMLSLYGFKTQEEFVSTGIVARYFNPDDRKRFLELLQKDGVVRNFEVQMKNAVGDPIWCSQTAIAQELNLIKKG